MKAMRMLVTIGMLAVAALSSGCMSLWSYEASKNEIKRERVYASGNKKAIGMIEMGGDEDAAIRAIAVDGGAGIAVDVSNWRALSKHPVRQIVAAILDAGMLYGAYRGVEALNNEDDDDRTSNTAGRDNNTVTINGKGNEVNIGSQNPTTTTSETTTGGASN